jgi:hypothetical protein
MTDLFPGFDENQLRDIGLQIDQVVSIDTLCQEERRTNEEALRSDNGAQGEGALERRAPTTVEAELAHARDECIGTDFLRNTN